MSQTVLATESIPQVKSGLDYSHFEVLSIEALRLIRSRRRYDNNGKHCEVIQTEVERLQELTANAVNDRLSTFRR
jgi:hypothetical protein